MHSKKLKSQEMKEDGMIDSKSCLGGLALGLTDKLTDIGDCRVAFVTKTTSLK